MKSNSSTTLNGTIAAFAGQGVQVILTLTYVVVLARLLPPEAFGLFGLTWIWIGFLFLVSDFGFSDHVLQTQKANSHFNDYRLLAYFIGSILSVVGVILGWGLSIIYGEEQIFQISLGLIPALAFNAWAHPYRSYLRESGKFTQLNLNFSASLGIAVLIAILMAFKFTNVWPLVVLFVLRDFLSWLFFIIFTPKLQKKKATLKSAIDLFKQSFAFGTNLTLFRLIYSLSGRLDQIILGFVVSPATLGIYNRIQNLIETPCRNLFIPISQIGLPYLSKNQSAHWAEEINPLFKLTMLFWLPFATLCLISPDWVISIALGDKWLEGKPWLQIFVFVFSFKLFLDLTNVAMISKGHSKYLVRWSWICFFIIGGLLIANFSGGPTGIAIHLAIAFILLSIHRLRLALQGIKWPRSITKKILSSFVLIAVFTTILYFINSEIVDSMLLKSLSIAAWGVFYAIALYLMNIHNSLHRQVPPQNG